MDISTAEFGWPVGMPTCRPMNDGLFKVRSRLSNGKIGRVLFYVDLLGRMVLLHGFNKIRRKRRSLILNQPGGISLFMKRR